MANPPLDPTAGRESRVAELPGQPRSLPPGALRKHMGFSGGKRSTFVVPDGITGSAAFSVRICSLIVSLTCLFLLPNTARCDGRGFGASHLISLLKFKYINLLLSKAETGVFKTFLLESQVAHGKREEEEKDQGPSADMEPPDSGGDVLGAVVRPGLLVSGSSLHISVSRGTARGHLYPTLPPRALPPSTLS